MLDGDSTVPALGWHLSQVVSSDVACTGWLFVVSLQPPLSASWGAMLWQAPQLSVPPYQFGLSLVWHFVLLHVTSEPAVLRLIVKLPPPQLAEPVPFKLTVPFWWVPPRWHLPHLVGSAVTASYVSVAGS